MKTKFALTIFIIYLLTSCEKQASHTYQIINSSSGTLKVVFTPTDGNTSTQTITISPDQITDLYVDNLGTSRVSKYKQTGEYLTSFNKIDVFKNDTIKAKTIYLKTDSWTYKQVNKHTADYIVFIRDNDF
jgi:hypothetical protein